MPETPDALPGSPDLADALRRYGEALEAEVPRSVADRSTPQVVGAAQGSRPGRAQLAIAAVVVLVLAVAIGVLALRPDNDTVQIGGPTPTGGTGATGSTGTSRTAASPTGRWEPLPPSPLSPRSNALALTVGDEVFVIGGDTHRPCPPGADCTLDSTPRRHDGAAYSVRTRSWRRIADAPGPLSPAFAAVAGEVVYAWSDLAPSEGGRTPYAYDVATDSWRSLPLLPGRPARTPIAVAAHGAKLVVRADGIGYGDNQHIFVYDPATDAWSDLPAPARRIEDGSMVVAGDELVVIDADPSANNSNRPRLSRAQAFDFRSSAWRILPDSEVLHGNGEWHAIRPGGGGPRMLVNLSLGSADGGQVNNFGRSYPYGGTLDVDTGVWAQLPDPASTAQRGSGPVLSGSSTDGEWVAQDGWAFEAWLGRWVPIDSPNGAPTEAQAATWVDSTLFVWGGVVWDATFTEGHHSADGWLWTPPDPKALAGPSAEPSAEPAAPTSVG